MNKKRILLSLVLTFALLMFYSCGKRHSKAYQALMHEVSDVEKIIQETEDCDELQMLNFSILGLHSDLENLQQDEAVSEDEVSELTDKVDAIEAAWAGKMGSLGCNQQDMDYDELDASGEDDSYPSF